MGKEKRCFVISPIGQPESEVREHADAVLDYIIRPALVKIEKKKKIIKLKPFVPTKLELPVKLKIRCLRLFLHLICVSQF